MKFGKWFRDQCGPRRSVLPVGELADIVTDLRHKLKEAENLYYDCAWWDRQREVALYAWQVKQEDKK